MQKGSVNKVILIGNVGHIDLHYTPSGASVVNLSIATNEAWKDQDGKKQERTEWHKVVVWRGQAEFVAKYIKKGDKLYIEGKLETRSYEGKDGSTCYTTSVAADTVTPLDRKEPSETQAVMNEIEKGGDLAGGVEGDDELPF